MNLDLGALMLLAAIVCIAIGGGWLLALVRGRKGRRSAT
jgi:hypothetical protein